MSSHQPQWRLDLGIFFASFSILLVELLLTRIFSVTMFHHFSFLAVSLAMMGLGASGLAVTLGNDRLSADRVAQVGATAAITFAVTTVLVVEIAFRVPIRLVSTTQNWMNAALVFGLAAVPFAAGGLIVALILTHHTDRVNRLYSLDLLGAALACLVFIPATIVLGAPSAVLAAAAGAALTGVVLAGSEAPNLRRASWVTAAVLIGLTVLNTQTDFYDVRVAKGRPRPPALASEWNSFSRVEVMGTEQDLTAKRPPLSWGYSSELDPPDVSEVHLQYDADALTQITGFEGDLNSVWYLGYDVTSAPYQIRRNREVLVIGAGGGRDILTALSLGSGPVTGVEVNPLTIDLMKGQFAEFNGGIYAGYPGIEIVQDDGRNFVRRTDKRFQLIQASLVDTWAASSAGAYSLVENSLYTVEAFQDYLHSLTPDGMVSFSRWYANPPVEVLRVVVLATEALRREGIERPARHIAVVRTRQELTRVPSLATILMKRSPFTDEELTNLFDWAGEMRFTVALSPTAEGGVLGEPAFVELLGPEANQLAQTRPYDLSVVTDERPFFFDRVPLLAWLRNRLGLPAPASGEGELTVGGQTLLASLVVTVIFTLLLVLGPLTMSSKGAEASPERFRTPRSLTWIAYFLGLGLGYIMVEIVALQRLSMYLPNPAYALSVVLFTMLSASGLGSLVAGRHWKNAGLPVILIAVCVALAGYYFILPWVVSTTLGAPTWQRVLLSAATTAPVAFVMGMPFPAGLRLVGQESAHMAAWGWAVNAGASVSGSVIVVLFSMSYGFSAALLLAIGAYALALVSAAWLSREGDMGGGLGVPA